MRRRPAALGPPPAPTATSRLAGSSSLSPRVWAPAGRCPEGASSPWLAPRGLPAKAAPLRTHFALRPPCDKVTAMRFASLRWTPARRGPPRAPRLSAFLLATGRPPFPARGGALALVSSLSAAWGVGASKGPITTGGMKRSI